MTSNVITYGFAYGLVSIAMAFLMYNGILGIFSQMGISIVLFIVILVLAGKRFKKENDGYATMGELFKTFALVLIIGIIISALFQFVYTMSMSEEKKEEIVETIVEGQTSLYEGIIPEADLAELEDKLYEDSSAMFDPVTMLISVIIGSLLYLVLALIPAAIMKKTRPEYS